MPYTDASGVQIPVGTDAFSPTAQFKTWQDGNAEYNNRVIVALDSDRTALASPVRRKGLECYVEATNVTWLYDGTTWAPTTSLACALRKSANQNLTTTPTALTWDVETSDPADMHNNSTNTSRITAPTPGLYEVVASTFNSNTSGLGSIQGRMNGSVDVAGSLRRHPIATNDETLDTTFSLVMAAGDYVEVLVSHSTATGNIAGGATLGAATVTVKRIG